MNRTILIFYSAFAVWGSSLMNAAAQTPDISCIVEDPAFIRDTIAQVKLFTGKNIEGKTYLHWNVASQHKDGVYFVFRSEDGITYAPMGLKKGIGTPIPMDIAYYFTDEFNSGTTIYYRVLHVSSKKTFLLTDVIAVTPGSNLILSATR